MDEKFFPLDDADISRLREMQKRYFESHQSKWYTLENLLEMEEEIAENAYEREILRKCREHLQSLQM